MVYSFFSTLDKYNEFLKQPRAEGNMATEESTVWGVYSVCLLTLKLKQKPLINQIGLKSTFTSAFTSASNRPQIGLYTGLYIGLYIGRYIGCYIDI